MRVVSIGECMLEVKVQNYPQALFGFGGDTFNTAYYLQQLGIDCAYATALGVDAQSQWLIEQWQALGINTHLVRRIEDRTPGIYTIQTDELGERSFNYWRQQSAAKVLFNHFDLNQWLAALAEVELCYLSLISIAVLEEQGRANLLTLLWALHEKGVKIAFDNNYRPALWDDRQQALNWHSKVLPLVDIYLPSLDDEALLYAFSSNSDQVIADHFNALPVACTVLKKAANGCAVFEKGQQQSYLFEVLTPVDSTAAGDSFNAGYIAAILLGRTRETALKEAHQLAGQVIMHPGALVCAQSRNSRSKPLTAT